MGIVAAVLCGVAAAWYPWPRDVVVDQKVNQDLIEDYETRLIRSMTITRFDSDKNNLDRFELRRKGERWVMPDKAGFTATADRRIAEVASSLIGRTIFDKMSDNQEDHLEYGVVDPAEFRAATNRASLGMKIELKDRNQQTLAAVIIGSPVKGDPTGSRHYVRIPGQPAVYTIDIPKRIFSTRFADWIDPNLFALPVPGSDLTVQNVTINSNRIDPDGIADAEPQELYRAAFENSADGPKLMIAIPDVDDGEPIKATESQVRQFAPVVSTLGQLTIVDVKPMLPGLSDAFKSPTVELKPADFAELNPLGFRLVEWTQADGFKFLSTGGSVSVAVSDGVVTSMHFGSLAQQDTNEELALNYYVLMAAHVDESLIEIPEKPETDEEASPENKAWLRAVAARDEKLKSAVRRVKQLNSEFTKWIYVVPETVVEALRPELSKPTE